MTNSERKNEIREKIDFVNDYISSEEMIKEKSKEEEVERLWKRFTSKRFFQSSTKFESLIKLLETFYDINSNKK